MNIIERGREFVEGLRELARRTAWDWRRCPHCGSRMTSKNGSYTRHPWTFAGRQAVRVQRHRCYACGRSYSERSPYLEQGSWYARDVHRLAVDLWQHGRSSLRRTAEWVRSSLGRQERWYLWRPLDRVAASAGEWRLAASTVHRWLDRAGARAQESVTGQLAGISTTGQMGTDGLWARLRRGGQRVVLSLVDSVSGLIWPPVVVQEEESATSWQRLFDRAQEAGLDLLRLGGLVSDGAQGLLSYLRTALRWVVQQRCVWHFWRGLATDLAQAVAGLATGAATALREQTRAELEALIHGIVDASDYAQAEVQLALLRAHPQGKKLWRKLNEQLDRLLAWRLEGQRGLVRISPEWVWRDFRLRLSRGRNHGCDRRLERAALVWAIYHNFQPAQRRSERKRHYKHPGRSPLEVAGALPGEISYLDALGV